MVKPLFSLDNRLIDPIRQHQTSITNQLLVLY